MKSFNKKEREKICKNVLSAARILKKTLAATEDAYRQLSCKDLMYIREARRYSESAQAVLEELNRKHGRQSKTPGKS